MMMKHDKEVCPNRADNTFKSIIRSGFYPRKEDKMVKPDRDKLCIKKGEFNPINSIQGSLFDDNYKNNTHLIKKQNFDVNKNKSSIDFNHCEGQSNFKRKNEFFAVSNLLNKNDIQCEKRLNSNMNEFNLKDNNYCFNKNGEEFKIKVKRNKEEQNTTVTDVKNSKSKSINLSNPIINPESEVNIFRNNYKQEVGKKSDNKTFKISNSNVFNSKNIPKADKTFKQFSMGKITTQPINSVTEKMTNVDKTKPITSFAHYKDTNTGQTFYK